MSIKRFFMLTTLIVLSFSFWANAQIFKPVTWQTKIETADGGAKGSVVMTAKIEGGWHVYSMDVDPNVGPAPLEVVFTKTNGVKLNGKPKMRTTTRLALST